MNSPICDFKPVHPIGTKRKKGIFRVFTMISTYCKKTFSATVGGKVNWIIDYTYINTANEMLKRMKNIQI